MIWKFFGQSISILLLILVVSCEENSPEKKLSSSKVIAVINGATIFEEEFHEFVVHRNGSKDKFLTDSRRNFLFQEFVMRRLLLEEAERQNIVLEREEVEDYMEKWTSNGEISDTELFRSVRDFLIIQKLVSQKIQLRIKVTLKDIMNYYQEHQKDFFVENQAHVLEIIVEDSNKAEELRAQLDFGDINSFKEWARLRSRGSTADAGGDLGTFEKGQLPADLEKFIFALRPGEVSSVFESDLGFHLFMLEEWIPRHAQKFYEVREEIFDKLSGSEERLAWRDYAKKIRESASVQVNDKILNLRWGDLDAKIK